MLAAVLAQFTAASPNVEFGFIGELGVLYILSEPHLPPRQKGSIKHHNRVKRAVGSSESELQPACLTPPTGEEFGLLSPQFRSISDILEGGGDFY